MPRRSAFVKVSGDLYRSPEFIAKVAELSRTYFVVICVGGGTQINMMLADKGIERKSHGPLGRELEDPETSGSVRGSSQEKSNGAARFAC